MISTPARWPAVGARAARGRSDELPDDDALLGYLSPAEEARSIQGTGIGLSIPRTIVQAHKGRIWAENQAGGGAVFRLSFPLPLS